ncbi:MAG: FG-GAP repeat protein [Myxococcota bacterium]
MRIQSGRRVTSLLRTSFFLGATAFLVGSGCDCNNPEVSVPSSPRVSLAFPSDGLVITSQDDINDADGIQVNVRATLEDIPDGQSLVLSNNVDIDGSGAPLVTESTSTGGSVVFSGYTLPQGDAITLRVSLPGIANDADCESEPRCAEVTVRVVESVCFFFMPESDARLTADQYPGEPSDITDPFEIDVEVDCAGIEDMDNVALRVNDGLPLVAQPAPAQPTVFKRVVFSRVQLAEGANIISVVPKVDASGENPEGAPSSITVTVDTGRCISRLQPGDGSAILADSDGDLNPLNGMQATIDVVTECADSSTVQLFLRKGDTAEFMQVATAPASTEADADGTRFRFEGVTLPESDAPFDVQVLATISEGAGGREGATLPSNYWVDSIVPTVGFGSPDEGGCFGATADIDDSTPGVQINAFGSSSGAANGSEVWFRAFSETNPSLACSVDQDCSGTSLCRAELCRSVTTVGANDFTLQGVTLPTGEATVEYIVLDLAGNQSEPLVGEIVVFEESPTVAITAPADGSRLGPTADLDPDTAGVQVFGQIGVENEGFALSGSVSVTGQGPVPFDPAGAINGLITLPLSLDEGERTLRARVLDSCGEAVDSAAVTIVVDTTPPVVGVTAYQPGGFEARDVIPDGGATSSDTVDLDVVVGPSDFSRTVTVSRSQAVETDGVASCTGTATQVVEQEVAADADGFQTSAPIEAGLNCFTVQSDDGFGAVSVAYVVNRIVEAPALVFGSPASGATLSVDSDPATPDFNADFELVLNTPTAIPGELTLFVGGESAPAAIRKASLAAGESSFTFSNVSLPVGDYAVEARFDDAAGNSSNLASINITVAGDGASFALVSPRDGQLVARDQEGEIAVGFEQVGDPFNETCEILIDGTPSGTSFTFDGTASTSTTVEVPVTAGDRSLTIAARCGSGMSEGISNAVSVVLRDEGPAEPTLVNEADGLPGSLLYDLDDAEPPQTIFVSLATTDQSSTPGFQRDIRVEVPTGGADASEWLVRLSVQQTDGTEFVLERAVPSGDPAVALFSAVDFGMGNGTVSLVATVVDNLDRESVDEDPAATPSTATLVVDRIAPVLTQVAPDPTRSLFTRDDDEVPDQQEIELSFVFDGDDGQSVELELVPSPGDLEPMGLVLTETVGGGQVRFSQVAFVDGLFSAVASATDEAGNSARVEFDFEVRSLDPEASFNQPANPGSFVATDDVAPLTPGFQAAFRVRTSGLLPGSSVRLCSTVDPTGGDGVPCEFGFANGFDPAGADRISGDGAVDGGPVLRGFVIGEGLTSGSLEQSALFLSTVTLAEGSQFIHFEVEEPDLVPRVVTDYLEFTVDAEPPVVTALTFDQNNPANDGDLIALSASEGSPQDAVLETAVSVTITGAVDGQPVTVSSNLGGSLSAVGAGTLSGGSATFNIALRAGAQTLSVVSLDAAGNPSNPAADPGGRAAVLVDFTAPEVSVPEPVQAVYSSQSGSVEGSGDDARLLLGSGVSITIPVSDDVDLGGGQLEVRSFSDASRTIALETLSVELTSASTSVAIPTFPFAEGANYLEVEVGDAVGNITTMAAQNPYVADFQGPTLSLELREGGGSAVDCSTFAGACSVATLTPTSGTRTWLDTAQNDLFYSVADCVSFASPEVESCPIDARLESRIVDVTNPGGEGDPRAFSPVSGGGIEIDDTAFTSFSDAADGELFEPGLVREVRLRTRDENGNTSVSNSLFLNLGIEGTSIIVERLAMGAPSGDILESDTIYGIDDNGDPSGASFLIDFRVTATAIGSELPDTITLNATSTGGSSNGMMTTEVSGSGTSSLVVDVIGVELATSAGDTDSPNAIQVDVSCGGDACGDRSYSNVLADIEAPTYQFDRCSLCELDVPFVGDEPSLCASCPMMNVEAFTGLDQNEFANIEAPATESATWNLAGDADGDPLNGYSTTPSRALRVKISGVAEAPRVELASSQATLTGGEVLAVDCPGATCRAVFANLGVPTIANGLVHDLGVSFVDRAGNLAQPAEIRGDTSDETIYAATDVTPPSSRTPVVCLGESTTPSAIADPTSDPTTFEDPQCTDNCAETSSCSRRDGLATLSFEAAVDDGDSGDPVEMYSVHTVPLGVSIEGTIFSGCNEITAEGPFEQTLMVTSSAAAGEQEQVVVSGLELSNAYCFLVEAVDDLGNGADIENTASQRVLPWLTDVPGQEGVADIVAFDPLDPDYAQPTAFAFSDPTDGSDLTREIENLGDMDGDGRDDLAVVRRSPGTAQQLWLFFSRDGDLSQPSVVIDSPVGNNPGFGFQVSSGDFDNDGLNDLAVAAPFRGNNGGFYLWWGSDPAGIRRDNRIDANDPDLPSINPDVAFFGSGVERFFGYGVVLEELDGEPGAEIVFNSYEPVSDQSTLYGVRGGSRDRLDWVAPTPGNPAIPVELTIDPDVLSTGGNDEPAGRMDFRIDAGPGVRGSLQRLATGDFDGNGQAELVAFDRGRTHANGVCTSCGEGYVYQVDQIDGAFAQGVATDGSGAIVVGGALTHVLRYRERNASGPEDFGDQIQVIPNPEGSGPDWLLVSHFRVEEVVVFAGSDSGLTPEAVPPGGLPQEQYTVLAPLSDRIETTNYGVEVCFGRDLVSGQTDVLVASRIIDGARGDPDARVGLFQYVWNPESAAYEERGVIPGRQVLGFRCADLGSYVDDPRGAYLVGSETEAAGLVIR